MPTRDGVESMSKVEQVVDALRDELATLRGDVARLRRAQQRRWHASGTAALLVVALLAPSPSVALEISTDDIAPMMPIDPQAMVDRFSAIAAAVTSLEQMQPGPRVSSDVAEFFEIFSTAPVEVPGVEILDPLTTHGREVEVRLLADSTNDGTYAPFIGAGGLNGHGVAYYAIERFTEGDLDWVRIAEFEVAGIDARLPPSVVSTIDRPPPGNHRYQLVCWTASSNEWARGGGIIMSAIELASPAN